MPLESDAGRTRTWTAGPVVAGTVVGFLAGLVGLLLTTWLFSTPAGGLVGAVGCGVAVALRSEADLDRVVVQSVVADVASSVLFFLFVLLAYLGAVALSEGLTVIGAIWAGLLYLVFGGLGVAVPVGLVSVGLAAGSAAITALALRRTMDPLTLD